MCGRDVQTEEASPHERWFDLADGKVGTVVNVASTWCSFRGTGGVYDTFLGREPVKWVHNIRPLYKGLNYMGCRNLARAHRSIELDQ